MAISLTLSRHMPRRISRAFGDASALTTAPSGACRRSVAVVVRGPCAPGGIRTPNLLIQTRPCRDSSLPEARDVLMPVTVPATSRSSASPGPSRRSTPARHSPSRYGCGRSSVRSLTLTRLVRGARDGRWRDDEWRMILGNPRGGGSVLRVIRRRWPPGEHGCVPVFIMTGGRVAVRRGGGSGRCGGGRRR